MGKAGMFKSRPGVSRGRMRLASSAKFENLPAKGFDILAALLFDEEYRVTKAALIPHSVVAEHAKFVQHTNSWRFLFRDKVFEMEGVEDVTDRLKAAEEAWAAAMLTPAAASHA